MREIDQLEIDTEISKQKINDFVHCLHNSNKEITNNSEPKFDKISTEFAKKPVRMIGGGEHRRNTLILASTATRQNGERSKTLAGIDLERKELHPPNDDGSSNRRLSNQWDPALRPMASGKIQKLSLGKNRYFEIYIHF